MTNKREARLKWALRYIICHPDMSPDILSEEWKISIDDAIDICAKNISICVVDFGFGKGERSLESIEKRIFERLIELK
jgi:hypothetical protein